MTKKEQPNKLCMDHGHAWSAGSENTYCLNCSAIKVLPRDELQRMLAAESGYPDNNPKTAFGVKKTPMHLCPPALTAGAAEAFANGAEKYGPYNWRDHKISASVYYAAVLRHLKDWWDRVDANDCAPDSGVHHVKHSAACLGMILDVMGSEMFNDDRPTKRPSVHDSRG